MKISIKTLLTLTTVGVLFISLSCKKKCDLGKDVTSGEIKSEVVVFPQSGYLTESMADSNYLITANHPFADQFLISTDGGITRTPVNYNEYSILCYPTRVSCFAQFDRNVVIDDVNSKAKMTILVKECGKCDEQRYLENYMVIRAIPDTYEMIYDVKIESVD